MTSSATLRPPPRLRPSVLRQDLAQCGQLARTLAWLEPDLDFTPVLDEACAMHNSELDFQ